MGKIVFIDKNKKLVEKVEKLFKKLGNGNGMEFEAIYGDVFEYKKDNPKYKICTASNPDFNMAGGLDKQIKDNFPDECKNLKEFVWTDNIFPMITVDSEIRSSRSIIKRALAGIFAYRYKFDFILTGIGTAIGGLGEGILLEEIADLRYADLRSANLSSANLSYADLSYANLRSANLSSADLRSADLRYANLSSADLRYADLRSAKIEKITQNELTINFNLVCPEEGAFIGWKKCKNNTIVKLLIPSKAKRSSATTRKCRASYVKVLNIYKEDGTEVKETISNHDNKTKYIVGKITKCDKWESDRWIECGGGIHFFITRLEAEQY